MALDITIYTELKQRDRKKAIADTNIFEPALYIMEYRSFMAPLKKNEPYTYEDMRSFYPNRFLPWMDSLREYVATMNCSSSDFYGFIQLSGDKVVIGPNACKILYTDFVKHEQGYIVFCKMRYTILEERLYIANYKQWKEAFQEAAQNGAIEFC